MRRLLYIEASPRKSLSASIEGASVFLDALRRCDPQIEVDKLDLWAEDLPEFDGATINAKYARLAARHGFSRSPSLAQGHNHG